MKSETTQRFELSADDARQAIIEWIEKKYGKGSPITVVIAAQAITTGMGMNEHTEYVPVITASRKT